MTSGVIFDVKRFAVHDGPGIRTTAFFKGCPLSCLWCHNPEGQKFTPELMVRPSRCTGCADCVSVCETKAIRVDGNDLKVDRSLCTSCGDCAVVCPTNALEMVGREISADALMVELERDISFFDQSEGGVTFSGGEPLAQPEFLVELLRIAKSHKIHTAIDTSGYAPAESVDQVAKLADLFLYDLKIMDDERHCRYVGVSNEQILDNLARLASAGAPVIVRIPVIPGYTDDHENIEAMARFVAGLDNLYPVDLLPYHRAGADKYARLGMPYHLETTVAPSRLGVEELGKIFRGYKIPVMIGGEWYGDDGKD